MGIEAVHTEEIEQIVALAKAKMIAEDEDDYSRKDKDRLNKRLDILRTFLSAYPSPLLTLVHSVLTGSESVLSRDLITLVCNSHVNANTIHEYLSFRPYLDEKTYRGAALSFIKGLRMYPQLPPADNYAATDGHVQAQVIALLRVVEKMDADHDTSDNMNPPISYDRGIAVLTGDDLIRLVIANPEKAEMIAQTIIERGTSDAALIASVIGTDAQSLSRGTL